MNNNFYHKFQTYSDAYFSKIMCRLQDDCCFETTLFQHDKIELHNHIRKKKKINSCIFCM